MENFIFQNPVKLIMGRGMIARLAKEIPSDKRIMITFGGGSVKKSGLLAQVEEALEKEGFDVERGTCNIETAFAASYGHGRPYIGILAEYDALSGLSQEGGLIERKEKNAGGNGDGSPGCLQDLPGEKLPSRL